MNALQSALAQPITDFLHYKQALNKKYQTETMALRLFDRYLFEHLTGDLYIWRPFWDMSTPIRQRFI